jgi:ParB family chromosome partitioning protein
MLALSNGVKEGHMQICYLPFKSLQKDPDNLFAPLSDEEYEDLRRSIEQNGIQEPLIVTSEGNGFYTVRSGNNRLKVAGEIGLKELPCIIIDKTSIEGAMDTELFRRHLSPEERAKYKSLKEKKCKEIIEKEMEKRLLPEFLERYQKGMITLKTAIELVKLEKEEQVALLRSDTELDSDGDDEPLGLPEKANDYEAILLKKEEELKKKEEKLKELNDWKSKNEEKLKNRIDEYEEKKNRVSEQLRKEFEAEIENMEQVNEELRKQLRKMEAEIETLKEEAQKPEKKLYVKRIEKKAKEVLESEAQKKYMVNIIILRLDTVLEEIKKARDRLKDSILPKKDASSVREKLRKIIEDSRELLSLIKQDDKKKREHEKNG